jgi:hypothetical protein
MIFDVKKRNAATINFFIKIRPFFIEKNLCFINNSGNFLIMNLKTNLIWKSIVLNLKNIHDINFKKTTDYKCLMLVV